MVKSAPLRPHHFTMESRLPKHKNRSLETEYYALPLGGNLSLPIIVLVVSTTDAAQVVQAVGPRVRQVTFTRSRLAYWTGVSLSNDKPFSCRGQSEVRSCWTSMPTSIVLVLVKFDPCAERYIASWL